AAQPASHHYSAVSGLQPLREAVAAKTARDSGLMVTPAQVLITNGGKQAIANAFLTLLDPGDEVIVPAPYWVTFPEAIALTGGVPTIAVTKAYAMTGRRVGSTLAPPDVTAAATSRQSHTTSNVANVSQAAALAAVTGSLDFTVTMRAAFDARRRRMHELLAAI